MAENKKSFILYADLIHTIGKLPDKKAGELFKHILSYVNDKDPKTDDLIINIAFEPIKQQLKRDLINWTNIREKRSLAGKRSAEVKKQKATKSTSVESVEQKATKSTVTVNVNDTVNDTVIKRDKKNDFNKALDLYGYCMKLTSAKKEWDLLSEHEQETVINHAPKFRNKYEKEDKTQYLFDFSKYLSEKMFLLDIKIKIENGNFTPKLETL